MKKINFAILFFAISSMMLLVYYGCKKDDDNNEEIIFGDSQTEEQNLIIDTCSVLTPSLDSIIDVNGIPFGNSKSILIDGTIEKLVSDLIAFTHAKCEEKTKTFHNESLPKHFGFAYSYGQRNLQSRLFPPAGNTLHNKDAVWGTDCSGLLVNAIIYAGISIENCNSVALPANLSFALAKSDAYKDIIVEDKGQLSIWQIKTGDIVLWPNVPHIGIVGRNLAGDVIIFQSNGTGFPADEASQTKNWLSETRGVHPFSMIKMLTMNDGWPSPYKVYRFKEKDPSPSGFTITTKSVSDITNNSALSGGDITFSSQVAPTITLRGVCWSLTATPTVSDNKTNDGTGTGSYSSAITGLSPSTTYYVRAFAESGGTIYYGNQLSFQTLGGGSGITVITKPVTNIFFYTAQSGGDIINNTDEILDISMRGICWSWFFDEPILEWCDSKTEDGAGNGSYQSTMDSLSDGGHYYVRAYAISNSGQVYYGNVIEFSTLSSILILKVDNVTDTFYVGSSAGFGSSNDLYIHYVYEVAKQGYFDIYFDSQTSWAATTYNFDHTCLPYPVVNFSRFELIRNNVAWYSYQPVECGSGFGYNTNGDLAIDIFNNDSIVGSFNAELFEQYNNSNTISISGWFKVYRYNR